jgi:hypothetical protein
MASPPKQDREFKRFAAKRIIVGVIFAVAILWTLGGLMGIIDRPEPIPQSTLVGTPHGQTAPEEADRTASQDQEGAHVGTTTAAVHEIQDDRAGAHASGGAHGRGDRHASGGGKDEGHPESDAAHGDAHGSQAPAKRAPASHAAASHAAASHAAASHGAESKSAGTHAEATGGDAAHGDTQEDAAQGDAGDGHESAVSEAIAPKLPEHKEKGVATVEAIIAPIEFELEERFWGWRPNDLINFTDNVNNYQLGVLEVTRRATVALSERISRTGVTDAFNQNLEDATNWFMIKATKYWFPSAENKYSEGIKNLKKYRDALQAKRATFYTRTDNLIPLLASFEDLLGSCDENLVKHTEEDGSDVSWFKADNYFYYAQGVAATMAPILEAIHHDFLITLETRHGIELLHHAVESCHTAAALKPWVITDSKLDGILANHRANMAAPISHARFYLGVLIKALST